MNTLHILQNKAVISALFYWPPFCSADDTMENKVRVHLLVSGSNILPRSDSLVTSPDVTTLFITPLNSNLVNFILSYHNTNLILIVIFAQQYIFPPFEIWICVTKALYIPTHFIKESHYF